jgi:putative ABC transport system permease protein
VIPLSVRYAARELRAGVRGFRIFLACLAIGVAAIAAAGSTAEAFRRGLASESGAILGGDLAVSASRLFTAKERAVFARQGGLAYSAATQAMAETASGDRRLVELRGVDAAYPLAGAVQMRDAAGRSVPLQALRPTRGEAQPVAVEQALLDKLDLRLGEPFLIGNAPFVARAVLEAEPDRMSRGFALGPRVLASLEAVQAGGFLDRGSRFSSAVRILLPPDVAPEAATADIRKALPNAGLRIRDRSDASPGIKRMIDRLEYFLGFIGLASLLAGGLGVAGAVSAYIDTRTPSIAVLKALGADGALTRNLYLTQVGVLALLGVAIGTALGAAVPFAVAEIAGDDLAVPALFAIYPEPLLRAALFGALAAAAFSLAPLARARTTSPASLFRRTLGGRVGLGPELLAAALAASGLAAIAVLTAPSPMVAGIMIAGVAVAFALLWLMGAGAVRLAGRIRTLARGPWRLGVANLAGPRSAARTAAPAIGLGVALLAAVVLIQSSLLNQIQAVAPRTAPSVVFTEIPGDRIAAFDAAVSRAMGALTPDTYLRMPMVSGRIVRIKGETIEPKRLRPEGRWAFDNDLSVGVADGEPPNAQVTEGRWWPKGYAGEPLAALDDEAAGAGGLKVGDWITIQALGVEMDARIAVIRDAEFGGFGPGFTLMLNQAAFEGATLRNVAIARTDAAGERGLLRGLATDFPDVDIISVREQLEAATALFDKLALAVRAAAGVAALSGLLVLAGAVAAGARNRAREAAVLKVLGASRGQVLLAYAVEYGAVGLIAAVAGVALGTAAAWPVVTQVFKAQWSVDWAGVLALIVGAAGLALGGGLLAAWQALAQRPAPVLRSE